MNVVLRRLGETQRIAAIDWPADMRLPVEGDWLMLDMLEAEWIDDEASRSIQGRVDSVRFVRSIENGYVFWSCELTVR